MSFHEKMEKASDEKDAQALDQLLDDDFFFIRHQSGKEINKQEMIDIILDDGPKPKRRNERTIYKTEDILVRHTFLDFPSEIRKQ